MPPRDYSRPTRKPAAPKKRRATPAPRPDIQTGTGYAAPKRAASKPSRAPAPSFTRPLGRADAPITQAQTRARRRTHRARRRVQANTTVGYVPKLRNPTSAQRTAARKVAQRAYQDGIRTREDIAALSPAQRRRLNRAIGYTKTQDRQVQTSVGREALRQFAPLPAGVTAVGSTLFGPDGRPLSQRQEQAVRMSLLPVAGPSLAEGLTRTQLASVGRDVTRANRAELSPGRPQQRLQAAGLNIGLDDVWDSTGGALVEGFTSGVGKDLTRFLTDDVPGFAGRAGSDLVNLPKNAVLGTYALGDAAVSAAGGDWEKAGQLWEGAKAGAVGRALSGDAEGFLAALSEHPLYSALELSGAASVAGRTLGTGARVGGRAATLAGAEGNLLARAGSTVREPLRLGDTGQVVERRYSSDSIRKGGQVLADRRRARRGEDPNVATGARLQRELTRAADETAAQAEGMRRPGRAQAQRAARQLEKRTPRAFRDLVQAAVEGEYRGPKTFEADLRAKYERLQKAWETERGRMAPDAKRNNRAQRQLISTILGDPKKLEQARARVFGVADEYRARAGEVEAELIRTGALDPDQARAARLRTYAVAHMGARFDSRKRAPEDLRARHEQARTAEDGAKARLEKVSAELGKAKRRQSEIVGRNRAQRGRDGRHGEPGRARDMEQARERVKALQAERRQAKAAHEKARRDRVASNPKKYVTGLVDADGNRISLRQIEEHIAADPDAAAPAFVSHRPGVGGTGAHFVNWFGGRRSSEGKGTRTGDAARVGGQDASFRSLEDSLVRGQGIADAARAFDRYVGDLGVKHPSGRMFKWDEAIAYDVARRHDADGNEIPGVVKMVPMRVVPAKYDKARADSIIEGQATAVHPDVGSVTQQRIEESLRAPGAGERGKANVVLVPEVQVKRLKEHQFGGAGEPGKVGQAITGAFRSTVLPFSTKWLTGNTVEAALRLSLNDTPPGLVASHRAGRKVMKRLGEIDEQRAREFDVRATSGLMYGGQQTVYAGHERFTGTKYERAAKTAAALRQVPIVKQVADLVGQYQRAVFGFNGWLEHHAQVTAVGKEARREMLAVSGSWSKAARAQKAAVDDVAKGLLNTPAQVRYARAVDETLGKYNKFTPAQRRMFQTVAPFAPWFLNSARFILHTLPVRHPVKTALLATTERTLQQEFEDQRDVPPGSLEGALVRDDGGLVDLARYTPFGVTADGARTLVDPFIPQFSSVIAILNGNSWTGNKLRLQDGSRPGEGKKIAMALYAMIEGMVPAVSVARRLQEGGETAFDDSTVFGPKTKPGTAGRDVEPGFGSALNRVFNPIRPTYLNPGSSGGAELPPEVEEMLKQVRTGAQERQLQTSASPEVQAILDEIRARAGR